LGGLFYFFLSNVLRPMTARMIKLKPIRSSMIDSGRITSNKETFQKAATEMTSTIDSSMTKILFMRPLVSRLNEKAVWQFKNRRDF
jgi:hypothetical protein